MQHAEVTHGSFVIHPLQLRLKDIAGRALLHADAASGRAALVIPVRLPPRLYRLDDKHRHMKGSQGVSPVPAVQLDSWTHMVAKSWPFRQHHFALHDELAEACGCYGLEHAHAGLHMSIRSAAGTS